MWVSCKTAKETNIVWFGIKNDRLACSGRPHSVPTAKQTSKSLTIWYSQQGQPGTSNSPSEITRETSIWSSVQRIVKRSQDASPWMSWTSAVVASWQTEAIRCMQASEENHDQMRFHVRDFQIRKVGLFCTDIYKVHFN